MKIHKWKEIKKGNESEHNNMMKELKEKWKEKGDREIWMRGNGKDWMEGDGKLWMEASQKKKKSE